MVGRFGRRRLGVLVIGHKGHFQKALSNQTHKADGPNSFKFWRDAATSIRFVGLQFGCLLAQLVSQPAGKTSFVLALVPKDQQPAVACIQSFWRSVFPRPICEEGGLTGSCSGEEGFRQIAHHNSCAAKLRVDKHSTCQVSLHDMGPGEIHSCQLGIAEVGTSQSGALQTGVDKIRARQIRVFKVCTFKVDLFQINAAAMALAGKVNTRQRNAFLPAVAVDWQLQAKGQAQAAAVEIFQRFAFAAVAGGGSCDQLPCLYDPVFLPFFQLVQEQPNGKDQADQAKRLHDDHEWMIAQPLGAAVPWPFRRRRLGRGRSFGQTLANWRMASAGAFQGGIQMNSNNGCIKTERSVSFKFGRAA